jgi:hypothetical protein
MTLREAQCAIPGQAAQAVQALQRRDAWPWKMPALSNAGAAVSTWSALHHAPFRAPWQSGSPYFVANAMQTMAAAWMMMQLIGSLIPLLGIRRWPPKPHLPSRLPAARLWRRARRAALRATTTIREARAQRSRSRAPHLV